MSSAVPGWYGKLPSLGDFAHRRLPLDFIGTWDAWLQDRIPTARAAFGESWLDGYLTAPIWRFLLLPGLVGASGWAGVLMPSVDRVGRHFPLTVAAELPSDSEAAQVVLAGGDWFTGLEEAALTVLDVTRGADDLDAALADHPPPLPLAGDVDRAVGTLYPLPSAEAFGPLVQALALRAWSRHGGWRSLWWTRGRVDAEPLMLPCAGLPTATEFAWLIEARAPAPGSGTAGAASR
jgi:type VI secretion system protein ImpM